MKKAGQMPRLLGLALASKLYRQNEELHSFTDFSNKGNEVAFGTIGNASTSEGGFWEVINDACVLQVPHAISVCDDGYGISDPAKYQTTKEYISKILSGFQSDESGLGVDIFTAKGWDYPELCKVYNEAIEHCRTNHRPVLIHITEVTQPQGHSTSGSHERYKSKERLQWETDFDCIAKMREWMISNNIADVSTLDKIEEEAVANVTAARKNAWEAYLAPIKQDVESLCSILEEFSHPAAEQELKNLKSNREPIRKELGTAIHAVLLA